VDDENRMGRDMQLRAWARRRIREASERAREVGAEAEEMTDPAVAGAARQFAEDLEAFALKWEARLNDVDGRAAGSPPV
jgi:hypothetical protein